MAFIHVDEEQVREMAREVAREPKTWDDLVWLLAEAELRLRPALVGGILYQRGIESREVELNPAQVIDHPAEEDVRELAVEVASLGPPPARPPLVHRRAPLHLRSGENRGGMNEGYQ